MRTQSANSVGAILNLVFAIISVLSFSSMDKESSTRGCCEEQSNRESLLSLFILIYVAIILTNPICQIVFAMYYPTDFTQGIHGIVSLILTLITMFLILISQGSEKWRIEPNFCMHLSLLCMLISTCVQLGQWCSSCCTCKCNPYA